MIKPHFRLYTLAVGLVFILLATSPILAVSSSNGNNNPVTTGQNMPTDPDQNSSNQGQTKKLEGADLKQCQNKEKNINKYMLQITKRAELQLNLFGTIAERVQKYYTDNNLSLSNYDELVAAIETARTQAQNTFRAMETNGGSFSCEDSDPKAYTNQFKNSFNEAVDGLKAYKTAVRNLIVGVKSVAEASEGSE